MSSPQVMTSGRWCRFGRPRSPHATAPGARRAGRSTRRSRSATSSCAGRSRRWCPADRRMRSWRCVWSIPRWAAGRFSSRPAGIWRRHTNGRSSTRDACGESGYRRPRAGAVPPVGRGTLSRRRGRQSGRGAARPVVAVARDARGRQTPRVSRSSPAHRQQSDRRVAGRPLASSRAARRPRSGAPHAPRRSGDRARPR